MVAIAADIELGRYKTKGFDKVALVLRFFSRQDGLGGEETYSLARDPTTDEVFILRCKDSDRGEVETAISVPAFLNTLGEAQKDLIDLIGTLVAED